MSPSRFSPLGLFRRAAIAEACTWALLLVGMFLKYVTETTELGVRIGGIVHGAAFIVYCLVAIVVWIDQRWSFGRGVLGLLAAVPPFFTIPFDLWAERKGMLGQTWRLLADTPTTTLERSTAWLLREPGRAAVIGVVAVVVLFGLALLVGPPTAA